jgi:hypothetical protein
VKDGEREKLKLTNSNEEDISNAITRKESQGNQTSRRA